MWSALTFPLDRSTLAAGASTSQPLKEVEMTKTFRRLMVLTLSLAATTALAGIADSPLPVLSAGATTFHLYSVPGVISSGGLRTYFSCTSTHTATMQAGRVAPGSRPPGAPTDPDVRH